MQLTHACNVFKQPLHTQLAMRATIAAHPTAAWDTAATWLLLAQLATAAKLKNKKYPP
jgi:hypothetical protein